MDQYGHVLARLAPGAALVRSGRELAAGRLNVLLPSAWLRRADPLPHSWDVTSDSIAAWFARALGARRLMLVKHEDGFIGPGRGPGRIPPHARRTALDALAGVVDPYFGRALDPAIACWIVGGQLSRRISRLIETSPVRPPTSSAGGGSGTARSRRPSSRA
jgi:aspartokinase-like uncharacterized kinase